MQLMLILGITLGLQREVSDATSLFVGIAFHACLLSAAVSLTTLRAWLKLSKISFKKCALIQVAICIFRPVGIALGLFVENVGGMEGNIASAVLTSLSTGIFLHVIFVSLIPAEFCIDTGHCTTTFEDTPASHNMESKDVSATLYEGNCATHASPFPQINEAFNICYILKIVFFTCGWLSLSLLKVLTGGHHH